MRSARTLSLATLAAIAALAARSDSTGPDGGATPTSGLIVLNGSQSTGLTLRGLTGTDSTFLAFTPSDAFDGGSIAFSNDTVISTSSKAKGDQLWVASLANRDVKRYQLPALSNPAGAAFVARAEGRIAVALRDSQSVAVLRVQSTGATTTLFRNIGLCPVDVAGYRGELWVVDANANCRSDYAVQGVARVVRLRDGSTARDTVVLPAGARGSSASIAIVGSTAYVATGGEADFSSFPSTFTTPGRVTKIDLSLRQVVASQALPAGTYGAGLKVGANGKLYVGAYTSGDFSTQAIFALDPQTLAFTGPFATGAQSLALTKNGAAVSCGTATADEAGNVYCLETNYAQAGATTVNVFAPTGAFVRAMQAGQYGADLVLR